MPPKNYRQNKKPSRGGGHKFTNPGRLAAARHAEEEEGMWAVSLATTITLLYFWKKKVDLFKRKGFIEEYVIIYLLV